MRRYLALMLALVLLLSVTACSKDKKTTPPDTSAATTEPAPEPLRPARIEGTGSAFGPGKVYRGRCR